MKLLSFDVGIKNLSFCIIEHVNNENIQIIKWEVIDLCNEKQKCIEMNNNKTCNKIAKYYKDNLYFCQIHSKKKQYNIPPDYLKEKILKKNKLEELINIVNDLKIIIDKPFTKNKLLEKINEYKSHHFFDIVDNIKSTDHNLIELGINLKDRLDTILSSLLKDIDVVLIENQISPIANRMKTIQGMIAQYLIMKGIKNITFYSAINKLKIFIGSDKTSYSERKDLSIMYTTQILTKTNTLNNWNDYFNSHKKKDDLADSFLQGLSYLMQKFNFSVNF